MPEPTLWVIAHFRSREGRERELESLLRGLIEPTRREEGCLRYELLRGTEGEGRFTFVEEWTSEGHLEAHLSTPHLEDAKSRFPDLVDGGVDLRRFRFLA